MLAYARTYPVDLPYTPEMLKDMFVDKPRSFPSPTSIASCPRKLVLERDGEWSQEPVKSYQAFRGTMAHTLLEHLRHEPDAILERRVRVWVTLPDGRRMQLAGKPDKVVPSQNILLDYKTLAEIKRQPKDSWVPQLSTYRFILSTPHEYLVEDTSDWVEEGPMDISRGQIVQLTMGDAAKLELNLWPLDATLDWIRGRMAQHVGVYDGTYNLENLPPVLQVGLDSDSYLCFGRRDKVSKREISRPWCNTFKLCRQKAREGI